MASYDNIYNQLMQKMNQQNGVRTASGYTPIFDPDSAARVRDIQSAEAGLRSQEQLGLSRLGQDFTRAKGEIDRAKTNALTGLQAGMADRGLTFSGINLGEQGKVHESALRGQNDLEVQNQRQIEDLYRNVTTERQNLLRDSEAIQFDEARNNIQRQLQDALAEAQRRANEELLKSQPKLGLTGQG